ncbi:hypothetical protein H3V53_22215 [Paraburkholderia bengalensis]|uniref:ATP-binding protein n=1 Tax=Paraburkholderia bengalensis TaxID=2747562 RepID=A0ABU8IWA1_9BURK
MLRHVDLLRTFTLPKENADEESDWTTYLNWRQGDLTWADLHAKPVTIVVGEAGVGKTTEFKDETARLISEGKAAFFVELSQLTVGDEWSIALGERYPIFEAWQHVSEDGYFLLDAVDEARLTSHVALKKALRLVRSKLQANLARVHVVISSRWTDWSVDDVQACVRESLVDPIHHARKVSATKLTLPTGDAPPAPLPKTVPEPAEVFVVSLSPLSISEARKLARAWDVSEEERFWAAVTDGGYEHLATRPLDLDWMVQLWKVKRTLGTFRELIEGSVRIRLQETNPSYNASATTLSSMRLRQGAEQLAAAAELSGHPYIACGTPSSSVRAVITPGEVLADWSDIETSRLLASALFDEATFARVKFHHRTTRAYLAACWLDAKIRAGVPFHRVQALFVAAPFGKTVLIPARRWTLSWLAVVNAKTREWIVAYFPEVLLFDGDPESWDELSADAAFVSHVRKRVTGFRPDWYNDAAEFMRVGRRLSSGLLARTLADDALPTSVKVSLFPFVVHTRLSDCAPEVFKVFADSKNSQREQLLALQTLGTVATSHQRDDIKVRLLAGAFRENDLIASALGVVDIESLSTTELVKIFAMVSSEEGYGHGPMASAIELEILPKTTVRSATTLLEAVVAGLPMPANVLSLNKFQGLKPSGAWLFDVLPACLERLLSILSTSLGECPEACVQAVLAIETIRLGWYTDHDLNNLYEQIAARPPIRWRLAEAFVRSSTMTHHITRMVWSSCLVRFSDKDLTALTHRANDEQSSPEARDLWFQLAKAVALGYLRGRARKDALAALVVGADEDARARQIAADIRGRADAQRQVHHSRVIQRGRERDVVTQRAEQRKTIETSIDHIRDASHRGTLCWLVQYSDGQSGQRDIFQVDYEAVARDFGVEASKALREGLKAAWRTFQPIDPVDYQNGTVPWAVILGLAGLYTAIAEGLDTASLDDSDAVRAACLAVWELKRPPEWFPALTTNAAMAVQRALQPWLVSEAHLKNPAGSSRRTLDLALGCSGATRAQLLAPLVADVLNLQIPSTALLKELFDAMCADVSISSNQAEELCQSLLTQRDEGTGLLSDSHWLRVWFGLSPSRAWSWFNDHLASGEAVAKAQVKQFVEAVSDFKWVKQCDAESAVNVLLQTHALVLRYRSPEQAAADKANGDMFAPSMTRLLETIPGVLAGIPGRAAHDALVALCASETDPAMKTWLISREHEHAASAVANSSVFEASDLCSLGTAIDHTPRSEHELFEQALSRLEELKTGVEEGPFSDRGLFHPGMKEKVLQLWLAARFYDTPGRRFTVHREEEVDDNNKTDIQLGAGGWKVCIEVKPVDRERVYSAVSLTSTLRDQVVGQYLKGQNSQHGILLLLRLDDKRWDVPGVGEGQFFQSLITYLQAQATLIKAEQTDVQELLVFGIDCVPPGPPIEVTRGRKPRKRKRSSAESAATTMAATDTPSESFVDK